MIQKNYPLISVLLPVYNGEFYLAEAIQSILDQTYSNFELLILSSPNTNQSSLNVIEKFNDSRIRHIYRSPEQNNLPRALNLGLDQAIGKYVARMDADDISFNNRLEEQVAYMENNPHIDIAGSWAKAFGLKHNIIKHPSDPDELKANLLFQSSLVHPTVIMRRDRLNEFNLRYNPDLRYCEDLDFWSRASEFLKIGNIKKVLLLYRTHEEQASRQKQEEQMRIKEEIRKKQFALLGINPNEIEVATHNGVCASTGSDNVESLQQVENWLRKITEDNSKMGRYNRASLGGVLGERWFISCYSSTKKLGISAWKLFWSGDLSRGFTWTPRNIARIAKFFLRSRFGR